MKKNLSPKKIKFKKSGCLSVVIISVFFAFGCQKPEEIQKTNADSADIPPIIRETISASPTNRTIRIDVPQSANKSPAELDRIFGKVAESKQIENGGEYRLYKLPDYPKGLAIRFYGGKAKSFNLILENPFVNSKDAIRRNLGIDVGNSAPVKDAKEPLSEVFQGTFGGVKFSKVSAKREEGGKGFIFVLAEIE